MGGQRQPKGCSWPGGRKMPRSELKNANNFIYISNIIHQQYFTIHFRIEYPALKPAEILLLLLI